jgi:hypothetical protein
MKIQSLVLTVMAALLIFSGDVLAAPGGGNGGGGDGGDDAGTPPDYGELIILYRDIDGVPYPSEKTLKMDDTGTFVDAGLCWQPRAFNLDDEWACPSTCLDDGPYPADAGVEVVDVEQISCAIEAGCAGCTQEVDFGRINAVRSPDDVFDRQLEDVIVNLATADCVTLDPAGRMVTSRVETVEDDLPDLCDDDITVCTTDQDCIDAGLQVCSGEYVDVVTSGAIDSPLQNLAITRQLLLTGTIGAPLPQDAGVLDTAARGIGAGSGKTGEVSVDLVAYLDQLMGLTAPGTVTILDPKLCEWYREEVQGVIQLVEKCFLDYRAYGYYRLNNFVALPAPAYIPETETPIDGWFEYLALVPGTVLVPRFQILQGPITTAVFADEFGFTEGNIGGYAQAADDARAVINFMHDWPMPDADVYATRVVCEADPNLIAYDVSISDVSGLQVPKNIVDGSSDREFIVNVANAGPDDATVTLTVTAIPDVEGTVLANLDGDNPDAGFIASPFEFEPIVIDAGMSHSFSALISVDIGTQTTINWTAVAAAPDDVLLGNNTATAVSNVKVTGSGGGGQGGKPN